MWNAIKLFFGFGQKSGTAVRNDLPEVGDIPTMPNPTARPKASTQATAKPFPKSPAQAMKYNRNNVNSRNYYRRGGEYYMREDNSLILDMSLIMVLMDMIDMDEDYDHNIADAAIIEGSVVMEDMEVVTLDEVNEVMADETETTAADIDAAVEAVARTVPNLIPEPVVDTEPTYNSYNGGSEYQGSSSTYSGGSSYSGGSDSSSSDSGGGSDSSSSSD